MSKANNLKLATLATVLAKNFDLSDKEQYSKAVKRLQFESGLNRQKCRNALHQALRNKADD